LSVFRVARTLERMSAARNLFFVDSVVGLTDVSNPDKPATPRFKWVHACNAGEYKGHHSGPFTLDREVFEAFVRNFRADPKYKRGELEISGETVTVGIAPVLQFDYEHASEMMGSEGSIPSQGAPAPAWVLDVEIRNAEGELPQLWALADMGDQLRGQLDRREYHSLSIAFTTEGVHWKTGESIGPMLTSIAVTNHPFLRDLESIAATNRARTSSAPAGQSAGGAVQTTQSEAVDSEQTTKGLTMSDALRKRLTPILKITALADDDGVAEAVEDATSKSATLSDLLTLLGVPDGASAMEMIPKLREAMGKLSSLQSELASLMAADVATDESAAVSDVAAALSTNNLPASMKGALEAHRKTLVSGAIDAAKAKKGGNDLLLGEVREARGAGREAFLKAYKIADPATRNLTRTLVAGPNGTQVEPPTSALTIDDRNPPAPDTVDLSAYEGSPIKRVMQHLSSKDPGFSQLSYDERFNRARAFSRTHTITAA